MMQRRPAWLEPDWPAPPGVRALSTYRGGGVSAAPYRSLNLADHVGDAPAAVAANRGALRAAALLPAEPEWLAQVHGIAVRDLDVPAAARTASAADAAVTRRAGRICSVLTADCLPLLLAAETGECVAAAHAGWRGLAAGVIEAAVAAMRLAPARIMAWLGPAIAPAAFEIGAEVREALLCADPGGDGAFERNARGRYQADLYALARRRLAASGIQRIFGGGQCTYTDGDRYFSHRRDGPTGRQASLIWLERAPTR